MNFLIFGCNGMAGHLISLYLKERGHRILGFARTKSELVESVIDTIIGDATDESLVKEVISTNNFDTIINCIGLLNQFAEENKADAVYINSYFPHYLAQLTKRTSTQVIHISTDCVFSGKRGQYTESDLRDGETFYDRSKALGEIEDNKNLTLRQSLVGPDMKVNGIGLMNWFLQQRGEVQGYSKFIWSGITTLELAKIIEMAAKERVHGLYNMVPEASISKYELLYLFNEYLIRGENGEKIERIKIAPCDRVVANKSLKRTRWDFNYKVQDYKSMIKELAVWMREHKSLYPHYFA